MLLVIESQTADSSDVLPGQRSKESLHIGYAISDLVFSPWCTLNNLGLSHSCHIAGSWLHKCIAVVRLAILCEEADQSLLA